MIPGSGQFADAPIGVRWRTTWISRFLPLGLTLDYVPIGTACSPVTQHVTDNIGSDHVPVIVDVAFDRIAPGQR